MDKKNVIQNKFNWLVPFVVFVMIILACSGGSLATPTAVPTVTPTTAPSKTPLPTNTPRPTSTPRPTETQIPTPAPVGEPVLGEGIEITVVDAYDRDRIYPGGSYLYTPNPGYMIIDMGVRIRNLNPGQTVSVPWNQVYVLEDNGDGWYPIWGSSKFVESGKTYDPFSIGISSNQIDGDEIISFENDAYLRLVYIVTDSNQHILFGIGASPKIELTLKK